MTQKGFTLIEIAIVLVIIAIMTVAVLGGQHLIGGAKAKDAIATVQDLRVAADRFRERYKYLPGDWPYIANEIQGVSAATTSGTNGDGAIEGGINAKGNAEAGSEVAEAPWQLYSAGFIGRIDTGEPQKRMKTSFGAVHLVSKATANGLVSGFSTANPSARNAIVFQSLPCDVVQEVDGGLDDGSLTTGRGMGTACTDNVVAWYAIVL